MLFSFLESLLLPENFFKLFALLFIFRFIIFSLLEYFFVAHHFSRIKTIAPDIVAMFFYIILIYPVAHIISNTVGIQGTFIFSYLSEIPFLIRVLLYFIVADFIH
jgi:hypothetical protein